MKAFEKLCRYFERVHKGHRAVFHREWSEPGMYSVTIVAPGGEWSYGYTFESCRAFREWIDGVVLD